MITVGLAAVIKQARQGNFIDIALFIHEADLKVFT